MQEVVSKYGHVLFRFYKNKEGVFVVVFRRDKLTQTGNGICHERYSGMRDIEMMYPPDAHHIRDVVSGYGKKDCDT